MSCLRLWQRVVVLVCIIGLSVVVYGCSTNSINQTVHRCIVSIADFYCSSVNLTLIVHKGHTFFALLPIIPLYDKRCRDTPPIIPVHDNRFRDTPNAEISTFDMSLSPFGEFDTQLLGEFTQFEEPKRLRQLRGVDSMERPVRVSSVRSKPGLCMSPILSKYEIGEEKNEWCGLSMTPRELLLDALLERFDCLKIGLPQLTSRREALLIKEVCARFRVLNSVQLCRRFAFVLKEFNHHIE